jgi:hypothetical protein
MGLAFWKNGCTTLPFFEPCPYTWKGEIFLMEFRDFNFFEKKFFLKLEYTWTFISTVGILVS